ncbi:MAG: CHRD domain-containing protein [Vicinamibacterales bacterium]
MSARFRPHRLAAAGALLFALFASTGASAQVVTVTAQLTGGEENPGILTGSHGNATITVDRAAQKITYRVNVYNLPSGLTASHIHVGPAGQNGPIIFNFAVTQNVSNDFAIVGELRAADLVPRAAQGINSFDDAIMAIASGTAYVNVHSQVNPSGEIRGQLCPTSAKDNLFNGTAICVSKSQ